MTERQDHPATLSAVPTTTGAHRPATAFGRPPNSGADSRGGDHAAGGAAPADGQDDANDEID